jgi:hypothetical protein
MATSPIDYLYLERCLLEDCEAFGIGIIYSEYVVPLPNLQPLVNKKDKFNRFIRG